MQIVKTTTRELRLGVTLTQNVAQVVWETTGHISVRLLDASGTIPLAGRSIDVDVPGEGRVSMKTDARGEAIHRDVPFQDYDLDVEGVLVTVPAVGHPKDVHERHLAGTPLAFVNAVVYDEWGAVLANAAVEVEMPSGTKISVRTDGHGLLRCHREEAAARVDATLRARGLTGSCPLAAGPQKVLPVRLERAQ